MTDKTTATPQGNQPLGIGSSEGLGPLPQVDKARMLGFDAIRYVPGYPASYVKDYATAYAAQEVAAERARWHAAIEPEIPADMKDWHQNSPDEWPSVTAAVLRSRREDAALAWSMLAAERERIRVLVDAVRDANAASQDDDACFIYRPAVLRAWEALLHGLQGPNVLVSGAQRPRGAGD